MSLAGARIGLGVPEFLQVLFALVAQLLSISVSVFLLASHRLEKGPKALRGIARLWSGKRAE